MTREEAIRILISCDKSPTRKFTAELIKRAEEVAAAFVLGQKQPTIAPPPNAPLALEELRKMETDWVWIQLLTPLYGMDSGYYIKHAKLSGDDNFCCGYPGTVVRHLTYAGYGDYWLAYRRKPEEVHP